MAVWTWAALVTAGVGPAAIAGPEILREGGGDRRETLNGMELTPFDMALLESLGGWSGEKPTAEELEGKVLVFVTWSSWYQPSRAGLRAAGTIAAEYPKDVVVIGVHHPEGFGDAGRVAQEMRLGFTYAHDAGGEFRAGLLVDQDPDFYIVDRAGHLRYADVQTPSVEPAVRELVRETREQAAALPGKLAAEEQARREGLVRSVPRDAEYLRALETEVPFVMPDRSAYAAATWPEHNKQGLSAQNVQGSPLPVTFDPGKVSWVTAKPNLEGRVVVLDFWATWCGPCKRAMPTLDGLARKHRESLAIVGVGGQSESEGVFRSWLRSHRSAYSHAFDGQQTVYQAIRVTGIPHVVILSTDGMVRWQGNPLDPKFTGSLEAVIAADPGVKARVAAKQAFLAEVAARSKGG